MNKLIITANPSSLGFTHKIADTLAKLSTDNGDKIELLNLYTTPLRQDFLTYEDKKNQPKNPITRKIQEKIIWANELVFIFPIWWGDAPAIMKNFLDCNFSAGFAFKYVEGGKAIGLLHGKSARIITTSGAPSFFYKVLLHIQWLWKMNRIAYCGIKQRSFTVFGNIDSSKTDRNAYLKKIQYLI